MTQRCELMDAQKCAILALRPNNSYAKIEAQLGIPHSTSVTEIGSSPRANANAMLSIEEERMNGFPNAKT